LDSHDDFHRQWMTIFKIETETEFLPLGNSKERHRDITTDYV